MGASMFNHPLGPVKEVTVIRIAVYSDSEGLFYECLTKEGDIVLVGIYNGEASVEVEGYEAYGGPQAERVLNDVRRIFQEKTGYDPENLGEVPSHSKELLN